MTRALLLCLSLVLLAPAAWSAPAVPLFPLAHATGVLQQDDVHRHHSSPIREAFLEFGVDLCGGDASSTPYWMRATIVGAAAGDVVRVNGHTLTADAPSADFRTVSATDSCPPAIHVWGERVSTAILYDAFAYCHGPGLPSPPCVLDDT